MLDNELSQSVKLPHSNEGLFKNKIFIKIRMLIINRKRTAVSKAVFHFFIFIFIIRIIPKIEPEEEFFHFTMEPL